ncbi:hypothetical protein [Sphingomonas elodea]|uniref:hypothetical protein n=1 Tax=Sphingomonas elodea TaxID=179878 RepID=UPI0002631AC9|nr:hypothetical protein [Sphingomonas elodea]
MTLRLAGLFADASALWRRERALVVPVAGVFFLLPSLGMLLLATPFFPELANLPDQAALLDFYDRFVQANMVPLALAYFALDYGTFALLSLYLNGNGRTLGQVLALSLRRLFPFLLLELATGAGFRLGLMLFVVPGLFVYARTWLAAPAYAAKPEGGLVDALRQGWARSAGLNGLLFLLVTAILFIAGLALMVVGTIVSGLIGSALGGGVAADALGFLVLSLVGALVWSALAILRVAAYRATEPRQGM